MTPEPMQKNLEGGLELARRYFMGDSDIQRAAHRLIGFSTSHGLS